MIRLTALHWAALLSAALMAALGCREVRSGLPPGHHSTRSEEPLDKTSQQGPDDAHAAYRLVLDTERWVRIYRGQTFSVGKLDAAGDFSLEPYQEHYLVDVSDRAPDRAGLPSTVTINRPPGPAYEYRSGRLIKGVLNKDGAFVPEEDSGVITLGEYLQRYDPQKSLRIYNLPGKVVKKKAGQAPQGR